MKRFLTKPVFEVLKLRLTKSHRSSLLDVIHAGIEHLDLTGGEIKGAACGGVLIPDVESYVTFRPLPHPIICVLQDATPEKKQPKEDWDLLLSRHIPEPNIDPKCIFVESVAITISRSIKEYPFLHKMSEKQLKKMEKEMKSTFKLMTMTKKNKTTSFLPLESYKYFFRDNFLDLKVDTKLNSTLQTGFKGLSDPHRI